VSTGPMRQGRASLFARGLTVSSRASEGRHMTDVVDQELDRLISKRASTGDPEAAEMLWKSSVWAHHAKIRRRNRAAWFAHFCQMADNHARISRDYQRRAEELCQDERSMA